MNPLTWQNSGQLFVAQNFIKVKIYSVAELRVRKDNPISLAWDGSIPFFCRHPHSCGKITFFATKKSWKVVDTLAVSIHLSTFLVVIFWFSLQIIAILLFLSPYFWCRCRCFCPMPLPCTMLMTSPMISLLSLWKNALTGRLPQLLAIVCKWVHARIDYQRNRQLLCCFLPLKAFPVHSQIVPESETRSLFLWTASVHSQFSRYVPSVHPLSPTAMMICHPLWPKNQYCRLCVHLQFSFSMTGRSGSFAFLELLWYSTHGWVRGCILPTALLSSLKSATTPFNILLACTCPLLLN